MPASSGWARINASLIIEAGGVDDRHQPGVDFIEGTRLRGAFDDPGRMFEQRAVAGDEGFIAQRIGFGRAPSMAVSFQADMRRDDLPAPKVAEPEFHPGLALPAAPGAVFAEEFGIGGGASVAIDGDFDAAEPPLRRAAAALCGNSRIAAMPNSTSPTPKRLVVSASWNSASIAAISSVISALFIGVEGGGDFGQQGTGSFSFMPHRRAG